MTRYVWSCDIFDYYWPTLSKKVISVTQAVHSETIKLKYLENETRTWHVFEYVRIMWHFVGGHLIARAVVQVSSTVINLRKHFIQ